MLVEQRSHVGAQRRLTGTGGIDEVVAFLRIAPERVGEDLACPLRLGRSHGDQPATRRGTAFAYTSIHEMFAQPDEPWPPAGARSTNPTSSTRLKSTFIA